MPRWTDFPMPALPRAHLIEKFMSPHPQKYQVYANEIHSVINNTLEHSYPYIF